MANMLEGSGQLTRRSLLRHAAAASALLAGSPLLGACGSGSESAAGGGGRKLRVGLAPFQDVYSLYVAEEQGYWDDLELQLEIVNVAFDQVTPALASNSVDIGGNNDAPVLAAQAKYPEQVQSNIVIQFLGGAIVVRPDGPFTTFDQLVKEGKSADEATEEACAQLRGKTILLTTNSDFEFTVAAAARRGGLDYFKDVKFIDGNPDSNLAAFLRGEADGYIGGLPQRFRLIDEGMLPLVTAKEIGPEATVQVGWSASEKLVNEQPDLFVDFQRGWYLAQQFILENPDDAFGIIVKRLSERTGDVFEVQDLKDAWNDLELFPPTGAEMEKVLFDADATAYWRPRYEFIQDFYLERGVLDEKVDLDRVFPFSWIHADYMKKYESEAWSELGDKHPSGDPTTRS